MVQTCHKTEETKGQNMAQEASCQGVWILSPSPQLKAEVHGLRLHIPNPRGHTGSASPTQGATQGVWIVGCLYNLTTTVYRQSPIAKGLHTTTQQQGTIPYRPSLFLQYECRRTHGIFNKQCTPVKRALGPTVLWPGNKFHPTPTATLCWAELRGWYV